jgi:5-phospho-D-xylono-1,4-lactonase
MWDPRNYHDTDFGLEGKESFEPYDADFADAVDLAKPHIMTVLGPIEPDQLGICQHQEHILSNPVAVTETHPEFRLDRLDLAAEELEAYFTVGGRSMVDASTPDYGRDLRGLRSIAQRVPVNLIAAAGRHNHLHAALMINALDQGAIGQEILADLNGGIRPGVLKFGTSIGEITDVERTAALAVATVALQTGYPISTHTQAGTMAHEQLDLIESVGVSASRVIVGHMDQAGDDEYVISVARRGAWISVDQIGHTPGGGDRARAELIVRLAEGGFASQVLVSQDLKVTSDVQGGSISSNDSRWT